MSNIQKYKPLESFAPVQVSRELYGINSVKEILKIEKNGISVYRKVYTPEKVNDLILAHIIEFVKSINVNQNLNAHQCKELANQISKKYYFLSFLEIGYVFQKAKQGIYPIPKFAINIHDVLEWFESHSEERIRVFTESREELHERRKHGKQVVDGKLTPIQEEINEVQLQMLRRIKEEMPNKEQDFQEFKKQYEANKKRD